MDAKIKDNSIKLEENKKIYFIYGKNGTGKTSIAKSLCSSEYKKYNFGKDFINKNIYSSTAEGEDISSDNKKNIAKLLLSEKIITLNNCLLILKNKKQATIKEPPPNSPNFKFLEEEIKKIVNETTRANYDEKSKEMVKSTGFNDIKLQEVIKQNNNNLTMNYFNENGNI